MNLKEILENSPALLAFGMLSAGFVGGIGTVTFLESREKALREQVLEQVRAENTNLKISNEQLDSAVRELLMKYVDSQALIQGAPLGGENSEIRKAIEQLNSGEIAKVVRDPTRDIGKALGLKPF